MVPKYNDIKLIFVITKILIGLELDYITQLLSISSYRL